MSKSVYPGADFIEWISWKKITRKTGIDTSHFRWTSERFSDNCSTLPSISISPLSLCHKPLKLARKSFIHPRNSPLFIELPPFTGSKKTRKTKLITTQPRHQRELSKTFHNLSSEMIPQTNFLLKKQEIKHKSIKRKKGFVKSLNPRQKLEGVIGKSLLKDSCVEI